MEFQEFDIQPHNEHYEGAYSQETFCWRRAGAIEKVNNLQSLMLDCKPETILEVGCGTGAVLAEVESRGIGRSHIGIDVADPKAHLDSAAARLQLLVYNGETIPFPTDHFDLVYASHVIEHVPDPRGLLREMGRVCKKHVYVEVPCELHIRTSHRALQTTLNIGHINAYTPESFAILLQTSDLTVKKARLFDHTWEVHRFHTTFLAGTLKGIIRRMLLRISPKLASKIFTYHFGVLCEKK